MNDALDPISFAVVKNALEALIDEVAYTVVRTARSEVVKDVMDYSAALCDAEGRMVVQAKTIALHLGAVPEAMQEVLARYGNDLQPGDAIVLNDPYQGGMHLPDIFMFCPIFFDGRRIGFSVVICHHTDVGGRVPGSNASDSTEIYQEGLRIPVLKLYEEGEPNHTLMQIIERNVRVPDRVLGDLRAQYAACQVGAQQLAKLYERQGAADMNRYMREMIDYAERMTRARIRQWPDGRYSFKDYIDDDGLSEDPVPIHVTLEVKGDHVTVDFAGSSPQVKAAINSTLSYTKSCAYLSVRCALEDDVPNNEGVFRCVTVKVPEGSVLNPRLPAAVAARALTGYRVVDAVFGALAQVVPHRIPAAGEGGNTVVCLSGRREDASPFIIVDMICGAWGGRPDKDGIEAVTNPSQNLSNTPIEVLEQQHPVRIEEYGLVPDSCGPGRFRGGLGIVRSFRVLADEALLQLRSDRQRFAPFGLAGGGPGSPTRNTLHHADGTVEPLGSKVTRVLRKGDLVRHVQAGGGGHGDPLRREAERLRDDLWNGKISEAYARQHHGYV